MGALISFAWLLSWVSRSHVFKKRAGERRRYPASLCSLSSGRLLSLTTLIVPRVDSSIHSFWSTRRTLALIKACREVSYWTQDCFLIPSTLTILVNRTPIQLPAWAFFFPTGFLLGLIFKVNAQMPRKAFSLPPPSSHSPHTALPHSAFVLEVHAKSNMREAETISGTLLHRLFLKTEWPNGKYSPHLLSSFNY